MSRRSARQPSYRLRRWLKRRVRALVTVSLVSGILDLLGGPPTRPCSSRDRRDLRARRDLRDRRDLSAGRLGSQHGVLGRDDFRLRDLRDLRDLVDVGLRDRDVGRGVCCDSGGECGVQDGLAARRRRDAEEAQNTSDLGRGPDGRLEPVFNDGVEDVFKRELGGGQVFDMAAKVSAAAGQFVDDIGHVLACGDRQPKICPTWVGGTEIFPVPPFWRQVGRIFLH